MMLRVAFCLLIVASAWAQEPVAAVAGDQQTIAMFARIGAYAGRLTPMLEQMKTAEWIAKGASETYGQQAATAVTQLGAVRQDMAELQRHPEKMQDAMKALFRIQTFHRTLDSLLGGLRKYQNPALADLIGSVAVEDAPDLQKVQDYILELANQKDQEYQVVEREAQRCRGVISREPAPVAPRAPARPKP